MIVDIWLVALSLAIILPSLILSKNHNNDNEN